MMHAEDYTDQRNDDAARFAGPRSARRSGDSGGGGWSLAGGMFLALVAGMMIWSRHDIARYIRISTM